MILWERLSDLTNEKLEAKLDDSFHHWLADDGARSVVWDLFELLKIHHEPSYRSDLIETLIAEKVTLFMNLDPRAALYGGLHDIGKTKVPKEILDKSYTYIPGMQWTDDDKLATRIHPKEGYDMLMDLNKTIPGHRHRKNSLALTAWIALTHHQWQDKPYPKTLPTPPPELSTTRAQLSANLYSRITALADQYEAFHRLNPRYEGRILTRGEIKVEMLKPHFNSERHMNYLINRLFDDKTGIF